MRHDSETAVLEERVATFKSDPEKLRQATEFVDQLIQQAKKDAELKLKEKDRSKFERVATFKSDPEKLRQATDFVDQLIQQAKKDAELKLKEKDRSKFDSQDPGTGNLKRRLGRARGFVLRVYDALCNCTQTAATAARTHARNNPFTKR